MTGYMSGKTKTLEELKIIKKILDHNPNGASFTDIKNQCGLNILSRTLQRRLLAMQKNGDLYVEGKARATKYFPCTKPISSVVNVDISNIDIIPLSKAGKDILRLLLHPLQNRIPVGYNREFLDSYRPNISSYLESNEIEKLEKIGKTAISNQLAATYNKDILSRLLIDLSWNSSRLEGNTYSLLDTKRLISLEPV